MTTGLSQKSLPNVIQRDFKGEGAGRGWGREEDGKPSRKKRNKTKPKIMGYIHI